VINSNNMVFNNSKLGKKKISKNWIVIEI